MNGLDLLLSLGMVKLSQTFLINWGSQLGVLCLART